MFAISFQSLLLDQICFLEESLCLCLFGNIYDQEHGICNLAVLVQKVYFGFTDQNKRFKNYDLLQIYLEKYTTKFLTTNSKKFNTLNFSTSQLPQKQNSLFYSDFNIF